MEVRIWAAPSENSEGTTPSVEIGLLTFFRIEIFDSVEAHQTGVHGVKLLHVVMRVDEV